MSAANNKEGNLRYLKQFLFRIIPNENVVI